MNILQFKDDAGNARPGISTRLPDGTVLVEELHGDSTYALIWAALTKRIPFREVIDGARSGRTYDAVALGQEGRFLLPLSHAQEGHCLLTGTGLTHRKSAAARDAMHSLGGDRPNDSLIMYQRGVEFAAGNITRDNEQPEWFYKGNANIAIPSHAPLPMPLFSWSLGEEIELTGVYLIDPQGNPIRIGYCLANESSDHAMEGNNYLYLAHSKLRYCSLSAEIIISNSLPDELVGEITISRPRETVWNAPYQTGQSHMTHTFENLEKHHFKYAQHRRPGDVHYYFMGASAMSFNDGVSLKAGDTVQATADPFLIPLRNQIVFSEEGEAPRVRGLI